MRLKRARRAWAAPEPTGVRQVDEALAELAQLDQLPTSSMSPCTRSCIANSRTHLPTSTAPEPRRTKPLVVRRARLDAELVRRGLARSRNQAAELVVAGRVRVAGQVASKVATAVGPDDAVAGVPTAISRRSYPAARTSWRARSRRSAPSASRSPVSAASMRARRRVASPRCCSSTALRGHRRRRRLRAVRVVVADRRPRGRPRPHQCP